MIPKNCILNLSDLADLLVEKTLKEQLKFQFHSSSFVIRQNYIKYSLITYDFPTPPPPPPKKNNTRNQEKGDLPVLKGPQ